jgi:hypothetical protein
MGRKVALHLLIRMLGVAMLCHSFSPTKEASLEKHRFQGDLPVGGESLDLANGSSASGASYPTTDQQHMHSFH